MKKNKRNNKFLKNNLLGILHAISEEQSMEGTMLKQVYNFPKPVMEMINWYSENDLFTSIDKVHSVSSLSELNKLNSSERIDKITNLRLNLKKEEWGLLSRNTLLLNFQDLINLEIKNIESIPKDIFELSSLESLKITSARDLKKVDPEIKELKKLKHLQLIAANKLENLPIELTELPGLKSLEITEATKLISIENVISKLQTVEYLKLSGNCDIPESISGLDSLRFLEITHYNSIALLPYKRLYEMTNLRVLGITTKRREDLRGISNLSNLTTLNLHSSSLTEEIGNLKNLESLWIQNCEEITCPYEFSQLHKLKGLQISSSYNLIEAPLFIPTLVNLVYLKFMGCPKLCRFSSEYRNFITPQLIELTRNDLLTKIPKELMHLKNRIKINK